MLISCPREQELRQSIARGQWPDACPAELCAHVSACRTCGDLALVSETFQHDRAQSLAAARPVPPALLLWRAQLRRRNAAVERIGRPLLAAQIFACVVALGAVVGFAGFEARRGAGWFTWSFWRDWLVSTASQWHSASPGALAGFWVGLASALAALALVGGAAVYLATDRR